MDTLSELAFLANVVELAVTCKQHNKVRITVSDNTTLTTPQSPDSTRVVSTAARTPAAHVVTTSIDEDKADLAKVTASPTALQSLVSNPSEQQLHPSSGTAAAVQAPLESHLESRRGVSWAAHARLHCYGLNSEVAVPLVAGAMEDYELEGVLTDHEMRCTAAILMFVVRRMCLVAFENLEMRVQMNTIIKENRNFDQTAATTATNGAAEAGATAGNIVPNSKCVNDNAEQTCSDGPASMQAEQNSRANRAVMEQQSEQHNTAVVLDSDGSHSGSSDCVTPRLLTNSPGGDHFSTTASVFGCDGADASTGRVQMIRVPPVLVLRVGDIESAMVSCLKIKSVLQRAVTECETMMGSSSSSCCGRVPQQHHQEPQQRKCADFSTIEESEEVPTVCRFPSYWRALRRIIVHYLTAQYTNAVAVTQGSSNSRLPRSKMVGVESAPIPLPPLPAAFGLQGTKHEQEEITSADSNSGVQKGMGNSSHQEEISKEVNVVVDDLAVSYLVTFSEFLVNELLDVVRLHIDSLTADNDCDTTVATAVRESHNVHLEHVQDDTTLGVPEILEHGQESSVKIPLKRLEEAVACDHLWSVLFTS
eukprot:Lankesteria_metandrocarpae@DN867_c0_g1_i1.p1